MYPGPTTVMYLKALEGAPIEVHKVLTVFRTNIIRKTWERFNTTNEVVFNQRDREITKLFLAKGSLKRKYIESLKNRNYDKRYNG